MDKDEILKKLADYLSGVLDAQSYDLDHGYKDRLEKRSGFIEGMEKAIEIVKSAK